MPPQKSVRVAGTNLQKRSRCEPTSQDYDNDEVKKEGFTVILVLMFIISVIITLSVKMTVTIDELIINRFCGERRTGPYPT